MKSTILIILALLFTTQAIAEDANVIKVENGVTVKSGTAEPAGAQVTKGGNVKNDFFDKRIVESKPASEVTPTPPTVTQPTSAEVKKPAPPATLTVKMKPIISPNSPGANGDKPKPEKKAIKKPAAPAPAASDTNEQKSPFKKSVDANAVETIKKPEPQPEVKAQALPGSVPQADGDGDIVKEIERIDNMNNEKSLATPTVLNNKNQDAEELGNNPLSTTGESGLPIPRFVSFKSGEVNARTGPGENYPIRWLYQRKNLPVEITAEFKLWRRIKDFDGEQSWVHHAMVSSRRYGIINRDATAKTKADGGDKVANFKRGVQVRIDECKELFCNVQYGKLEGWVPKKNLWGVYGKEVFH